MHPKAPMLTIAHAPLLPTPTETDAMADERRGDREREDDAVDYRVGPPDRRYYPPPVRETNWPAIFATLVTILIAMAGYNASILNDIKRDFRATSDKQIADSATYAAEKAQIRRELDANRNDIDTVIKAFQTAFNRRLAVLEVKNGIDPPRQPPQPQQPQGD